MNSAAVKQSWLSNYSSASKQLDKMSEVKGLVSAFNANIDAVIKVSGQQLQELIQKHSIQEKGLLIEGDRHIQSPSDALRGLIHCFKAGIAEEWLIEDVAVFNWLNENLGYDKMQMGGQGGIVANVMAVCGVDPVYVHCASLPKEQSGLFLDLDNLQSTDASGQLKKACSITRDQDIPLIHWIIEFDKNDQITLDGTTFTCPKSNRFIATYDPLNFKLHIDPNFTKAVGNPDNQMDYVILSGYQMLQETLPSGQKGAERIEASMTIFEQWKENHPNTVVHLEMASTQDPVMRKYLLDTLARKVDSLGFNERELIDLLEVMQEDELAKACDEDTSSANLFSAMLKVQAHTQCPRLQLHMFGLYLTLQEGDFKITPEQNRNGMQLAAVIAAAKAGTGAINSKDVLLWADGKEVSDRGLEELAKLKDFLADETAQERLMHTGLGKIHDLDMIAVPTILIEKPITLVGMGDTISSISLVAAN